MNAEQEQEAPNENWEFNVVRVNNLTIRGALDKPTEMISTNFSADVMGFFACNNLTLENLFLVHETSNTCGGNVAHFSQCRGVVARNCVFNGCGAISFNASWCDDFLLEHCTFENCSIGLASIDYSTRMRFKNCLFHEAQRTFYMLDATNSNISFEQCTFKDFSRRWDDHETVFRVNHQPTEEVPYHLAQLAIFEKVKFDQPRVEFEQCNFTNLDHMPLRNNKRFVHFNRCTISDSESKELK